MKNVSYWTKVLVPALLSVLMVVSCNTSDDTATKKDKPTPGKVVKPDNLNNQAAMDGVIFNIKSVVYTNEEVSGSTVFYFSPTAGITTPEGMQQAGDYIRTVVGKTNGSNAVFTETDNEINYKNVHVDASNCGDYTVSSLFVLLESPTLLEFTMEVAAKNGTMALSANYYGYCSRWPSNNIEDEAVAVCTEMAQAVYFGQGAGTNAHDYEILVSTSRLTQATDGTLVLLEETGYAMHIAFLAIPNSANRARLPQGTYKSSVNSEAGTYLEMSYLAEFSTENGHQTMKTRKFDGDITVTTDSNDITTVRAYFIDESGRRTMIAYRGKISFMSMNSSTYMEQFDEDVDLKADVCDAVYYGRMGEENYGSFELVMYQQDYLDGVENTFGGTFLLTAPSVFPSETELKNGLAKLYGTYNAANTFTIANTWFRPVEVNVYGMIQPYGTFLHKNDGTYYGQFGYGEDGTVTISAGSNGGLRIEFDMVSVNGSKMRGVYDGPVNWTWAPMSSSSDDGTSTLTEDYTMDLSRIDRARLVAPQQLWIQGIGYTLMSQYSSVWSDNEAIGYQYIAFGNIGVNNNPDGTVNAGDFAYVELATAPGEERQLKAGHYTVSKQRWPAYFHPMRDGEGVAIRGIMLQDVGYTAHWEHHYASEGGLSIIDGHAYFYAGEMTVKGPDAQGHYTFDFDFECVREHHVRGSWTGPVDGIESGAYTESWHAPMEIQPAAARLGGKISGEQARMLERAGAEAAKNAPAFGRL